MLDCSLLVALCPMQSLLCQFARIKQIGLNFSIFMQSTCWIGHSPDAIGITRCSSECVCLPLLKQSEHPLTISGSYLFWSLDHSSITCSDAVQCFTFLFLNCQLQLSFLEFRNYRAEYFLISQNILFSDLSPAYQVPAWGKDKEKLALILQNWLNKSCAAGLREMCPVTASRREDLEG